MPYAIAKPESRALADVLRRIERFEDARQRVRGNARAGVAHLGDDPIARGRHLGGHFETAGVAGRGNRVFGVHHHVQKYLVEQQRVALDARQMLVIVSHDFDAGGAVGRGAQRQYFLQHAIEADRPPREAARPAKTRRLRTILAARSASR